MKINSETLFEFINNLGTNEKVKFKVYYDDNYVTEIYWDGENFNWKPGTFNSGAFFNPLYDFEEIIEDKPEKIEKISIQKNRNVKYPEDNFLETLLNHFYELDLETRNKMNEVIDKLNYLLEKSDKDV